MLLQKGYQGATDQGGNCSGGELTRGWGATALGELSPGGGGGGGGGF